MKIGNRLIGPDQRPYLIAEIGVNFMDAEDPTAQARALIASAAAAGADAVKFQVYTAQGLTVPDSPVYFNQVGEAAPTQRAFFERYEFDWDLLASFADVATASGVDFLCTPFDAQAVAFLESLVPAWKIASADLTNGPLLRLVAETGKPVILSTGGATFPEIDQAMHDLRRAPTVVLLHCVLRYPCPAGAADLERIARLQSGYGGLVGWSDHVPVLEDGSPDVMLFAACLGACVLEKHYTWDRTLPGNDHAHAMDADGLRWLARMLDREQEALVRDPNNAAIERENAWQARRSVVAVRDLPVGHVIAPDDVTLKRPGTGLGPSELPSVVGATVREPIPEDTLIRVEQIARTEVPA